MFILEIFFYTGKSFIWKRFQSSRTQIIITYGLNESALLKRITWEQGGLPRRCSCPYRQLHTLGSGLVLKVTTLSKHEWLGFMCPRNIFTSILKVTELVFLSMCYVLGSVPGTFICVTLRRVTAVPTLHMATLSIKEPLIVVDHMNTNSRI